MKILPHIWFFLLFILITISDAFTQPGPPGGGMGGPPCWPPSTCDPQIPINGELWLLLIAGLILGFYYFKKKKSSTATP